MAMAQCGNQKKKLSTSSQNIRVVVRVRPLNNDEKERRVKTVVHCTSPREIQTKEKKYHFDRVFEPGSCQMDIYAFVVAPMINDVLAGYNCTVFAYGQTGTGKTHTMTGGDPSLSSSLHWKEDELAGCIPRAAANIFDEIGSMKVIDYNVRVSFLELYNEEVRDLLSHEERPPPLNIFNDSKGSVCIQNLQEITVFNSNDIYMLLQQGTLKRQTAATLMNNHSSRSHTVFTITVHTRESNITGEEVLKTGKINLVDLAGSENIAKSGAKDKRAQELANINRSLLTLGRVIQILAEKNNKHVPYRDSKLTRILQDSLGGHTKTCIIATVSPSHTSYEETQSTLEYACRARDIRNTPMVNEKVTKAQMMKEMTNEIEKLKKDLDAARSGDGFFINKGNWEELNSQLQSSSNALSLKNEIIGEMKKKVSDLETIRNIKTKEFEEVMNVCQHKEKMIDKAKALLKEQKLSLKQEQYLSSCYLEAATENKIQAKELFEVTQNLSKNQDILQRKLENQYFNNYSNEKTVKERSTVLSNNLAHALTEVDNLKNITSTTFANHNVNIHTTKTLCKDFAANLKFTWENESQPLIESDFEKHKKLIEDSAQNTIEGNVKSQEEINEMLGFVDAGTASCSRAYDDFEKYDEWKSSKMNVMESFLTNLSSHLLKVRQKKQIVLHDLKDEISELDSILNIIEESKLSWSCDPTDESDRKAVIKRRFDGVHESYQSLCESLKNTKKNLDSQYQCVFDNKERLLSSHQEMKDHVNQQTTEKLNLAASFARNNTLHLESLEDDMNSLDKSIDNHVSELKTILHSIDDIGKDIVTKIIPVKREGDTPKQNNLSYPKRVGERALARDALIKRFKDEFKEDIENESFHLNVSTDSIAPLDISDDKKLTSEES